MLTNAQAVSGQLTAVKLSRRASEYRHPHHRVKRPRQIFPGRKDRRPPQPPATAPMSNITGLPPLVLLLALQERDLPPKERRLVWALADRWAREIVDARLARGTI